MSTVGGIRLTEPGADLAIALAIASAVNDQALPATLAAVGEISLAGEIRPVTAAKQRAAEAKRLGYTTIVDGDAGPLNEAILAAFATGTPPAGWIFPRSERPPPPLPASGRRATGRSPD